MEQRRGKPGCLSYQHGAFNTAPGSPVVGKKDLENKQGSPKYWKITSRFLPASERRQKKEKGGL